MKRVFNWAFGLTALLLGLPMLAFAAYVHFVEMPEDWDTTKTVTALVTGTVFSLVGYRRVKRGMRGREEPA